MKKVQTPIYVRRWYAACPWVRPTEEATTAAGLQLRYVLALKSDIDIKSHYEDNAESRRVMGRWTWRKIRRLLPDAAGRLYRWVRFGNCNEFAAEYVLQLQRTVPRGAMRLLIVAPPGKTLRTMSVGHMVLAVYRPHDPPVVLDNNRPGRLVIGLDDYEVLYSECPGDPHHWLDLRPDPSTLWATMRNQPS